MDLYTAFFASQWCEGFQVRTVQRFQRTKLQAWLFLPQKGPLDHQAIAQHHFEICMYFWIISWLEVYDPFACSNSLQSSSMFQIFCRVCHFGSFCHRLNVQRCRVLWLVWRAGKRMRKLCARWHVAMARSPESTEAWNSATWNQGRCKVLVDFVGWFHHQKTNIPPINSGFCWFRFVEKYWISNHEILHGLQYTVMRCSFLRWWAATWLMFWASRFMLDMPLVGQVKLLTLKKNLEFIVIVGTTLPFFWVICHLPSFGRQLVERIVQATSSRMSKPQPVDGLDMLGLQKKHSHLYNISYTCYVLYICHYISKF